MTRTVTIQELLRVIKRLPPTTPGTDALFKSGYNTHQDHWIGWLGEYNTEGFYGRSDTAITDARTVYNRLNCAPMMIWLAEGIRVPPPIIHQALLAFRSASAAGKNEAAKAAAVRRIVPWDSVASRL